MTQKKMKSSKVKTVIVECKMKDSTITKEYDVDPEIFDDFLAEAATRFVEQHIKNQNSKIPPVLHAYEKKSKPSETLVTYNSYYIIINAGFHRKAEIMRKNFMVAAEVDLKTQPFKTDGRSKQQNN